MIHWCGTEDEGVHALADRLRGELLHLRRARALSAAEIDWPAGYSVEQGRQDRRRQVRQHITGAICGSAKQSDERAIANFARGLLFPSGGIAIMVHAPIDAGMLPVKEELRAPHLTELLTDYMATLHSDTLNALNENTDAAPIHIVILVRIDAAAGDGLRTAVEIACRENVTDVEMTLLPELRALTTEDIEVFIDAIREQDPQVWKKRSKIAQEIYMKTHGIYEPTRRALEAYDQ
jgi:hypothetical protein